MILLPHVAQSNYFNPYEGMVMERRASVVNSFVCIQTELNLSPRNIVSSYCEAILKLEGSYRS